MSFQPHIWKKMFYIKHDPTTQGFHKNIDAKMHDSSIVCFLLLSFCCCCCCGGVLFICLFSCWWFSFVLFCFLICFVLFLFLLLFVLFCFVLFFFAFTVWKPWGGDQYQNGNFYRKKARNHLPLPPPEKISSCSNAPGCDIKHDM